MPLVEEGPGIEARANVLASQSLAAQLRVLQAFLPLQGWLVGRNCDTSCAPVVSSGIFTALSREDLVLFFGGEWGGDPVADGFSYRCVNSAERQILGWEPADSASPVYLVKANLDVLETPSGGCVLGLTEELPSRLSWRVDEVRSCLTALALTLALHSELNVAENLMLELRRDAFLDPLTGTLNRAGWINRLAHIDAISGDDSSDAAIVMLDLDFLKVVNDTYGHSAGDDLIRLTAQTISSVLRSNDAVGRLGGDEFGVVAQFATPVVAAALVSRLKHALDAVGVRISMGMALKSEAGTLKKTMHLADERMYEDKRTKPMPRRLPLSVRIGMAVG